MGGKAMVSALAAAIVIGLPGMASAQVESMRDFQISDAAAMGDKFAQLAEAFDQSHYDWRPMEGVRSVRDVLALAVAEANLFPGMWGATAPAGVGSGFAEETARVAAMDKAAVAAAVRSAFGHFARVLEEMSDETRAAEGNTFGRTMTNSAGISLAMSDMHEHLGQLIAYARTNQVVPPWSGGGM